MYEVKHTEIKLGCACCSIYIGYSGVDWIWDLFSVLSIHYIECISEHWLRLTRLPGPPTITCRQNQNKTWFPLLVFLLILWKYEYYFVNIKKTWYVFWKSMINSLIPLYCKPLALSVDIILHHLKKRNIYLPVPLFFYILCVFRMSSALLKKVSVFHI